MRATSLSSASGELVASSTPTTSGFSATERQVARYDAEKAGRRAPVGIVAWTRPSRARPCPAGRVLRPVPRVDIDPLTLDGSCRATASLTLVPGEAGEVGWLDPELFETRTTTCGYGSWRTGRRVVLNEEVLAVYRKGCGVCVLEHRPAGRQQPEDRLLRSRSRAAHTEHRRRIARLELRYNRAMEAMAAAWFDQSPGRAIRSLPNMVWSRRPYPITGVTGSGSCARRDEPS